jgi:hypothetical protein
MVEFRTESGVPKGRREPAPLSEERQGESRAPRSAVCAGDAPATKATRAV